MVASRETESSDQTLETRVRAAIRSAGIKHSEVARSIGIEPSKLSKSLAGTRRFRVEEISHIAELTHVTTDWLTTGRNEEPPRRRMVARLQDSHPDQPDRPQGPAVPEPDAPSDPEWMSKGTRNRLRIIAAAWELYADRGIDNVRNHDIAAASGLSTSAVNYHFRTKTQLLQAALRHSLDVIAQTRDLNEPVEPVTVLRRFARMHAGVDVRIRRVWSIWLQSWARATTDDDARANLKSVYGEWLDMMSGVILAGQHEGTIRAGDTALMVKSLSIFIDGLGVARSTGQVTITDDEALTMLETYLRTHILTDDPRNQESERAALRPAPTPEEEGT